MTKEERKEYDHQRYLKRREQILERNKKWNEEHKEERSEYMKLWGNEHKEERTDYMKQWNEEHKEEKTEYMKQWREDNQDYYKQYRQTPIGRGNCLAADYRKSDKHYNRGECTIEGEWIVDNIFSSKCFYCGETDWTELGCDRIDNSLPHTPDNVVCCCEECNKKRGSKSFEEFCKEMGVAIFK